jgi:S-adenosylmethionine hydrolase
LIAFIDSTGHLALAVVNGSAKKRLRADVGTEVEVIVGE